jgi:hypothetical protein
MCSFLWQLSIYRFYPCVFLSHLIPSLSIDFLLTIMFKHCTYIPSYISYAKVYSYVAPPHLAICLPRERLQGTTSTPVVPVFFGRKISNVRGVHHKNKPPQVVPCHFLPLKKYRIVFFGPMLLEL